MNLVKDITEGRLTKVQVDNYVYNLRTLLDEHREWCLLFAMTGQALKKIKKCVTASRGSYYQSLNDVLQDLNTEEAIKIVKNYLMIAKYESNDSITSI